MSYRGHSDWTDMSDYVVHFTKPVGMRRSTPRRPKDTARPSRAELIREIRARQEAANPSGYYPWIDILGEGRLKPGEKPLGAARAVSGVEHLHRVVCFSEIPLDMLDRLIRRRSLYGVGFRKETLVANGGAPLWYLDKDGAQAKLVQQQIRMPASTGVDPDDPIWKLTPFIDSPGNYAGREYRFEWEREWRVVGDFAFKPEDVAFLFLPEGEHEDARQFFANARIGQTGPAYLGAYIDPRWGMDKIQHALSEVPAPPKPDSSAMPWWL